MSERMELITITSTMMLKIINMCYSKMEYFYFHARVPWFYNSGEIFVFLDCSLLCSFISPLHLFCSANLETKMRFFGFCFFVFFLFLHYFLFSFVMVILKVELFSSLLEKMMTCDSITSVSNNQTNKMKSVLLF